MTYSRNPIVSFLLVASLFLLPIQSAWSLDRSGPDVLLEVTGKISITNDDPGKAVFDRALLDRFPRVTIQTHTPWTDGLVTFEGFLVRDLIKAVGASGETLKATAINDYAIDIPLEDFRKYDAIIADTKNGARMTVRDKGPLWIIYPWDSVPELKNEIYHSRSIWQLNRIVIE